MRVAFFILPLLLSLVSTHAVADWTFFSENTSGDIFFIDYATLKKGARPRAWTLCDYVESGTEGTLSNKVLYEVSCSEGKLRMLASRFYQQNMGKGSPSEMNNETREWLYVTPGTVHESLFGILCPQR